MGLPSWSCRLGAVLRVRASARSRCVCGCSAILASSVLFHWAAVLFDAGKGAGTADRQLLPPGTRVSSSRCRIVSWAARLGAVKNQGRAERSGRGGTRSLSSRGKTVSFSRVRSPLCGSPRHGGPLRHRGCRDAGHLVVPRGRCAISLPYAFGASARPCPAGSGGGDRLRPMPRSSPLVRLLLGDGRYRGVAICGSPVFAVVRAHVDVFWLPGSGGLARSGVPSRCPQ